MVSSGERRFDADSTTNQVLEGLDLGGRRVLITGGSGGLGAETGRALAASGAEVMITARDIPKGEKVAEEIRSSTGNPAVSVGELELGSFASIRTFADRYLGKHDSVDILINNAGVMACPQARTSEGHEMQFGTCHLGHFLLTNRLLPALRASGAARIVNVSSHGHRFSDVHLEDPDFQNRDYDKWQSYGQAKTANILHAVELDRRFASMGIRAFALHPGAIMTELGRYLTTEDLEFLQGQGGALSFKSVEAGAATSCWAATAPELDGKGGLYLDDCQIAEAGGDLTSGVAAYALDPATAAKLWKLSEELVGERV